MKRSIIFIVILLVSLPSYAQKISEKIDNEEQFSITTTVKITPSRMLGVAGMYSYDKATKKENYAVFFQVNSRTGKFSFDKGSLLLIRTFKGSYIELIEFIENKNVPVSNRRLSTVIDEYSALSIYMISQKNIQKLIEEGVQKIRFDSTAGLMDFTYENDEIGKTLEDVMNVIKQEKSF